MGGLSLFRAKKVLRILVSGILVEMFKSFWLLLVYTNTLFTSCGCKIISTAAVSMG